MTKLYVSNTSTDELKDLISAFGKDELELDEFDFFIRSYNVEGTNDHIFECVFHEDCYDLFDIDQFIQSLNNPPAVGYCLFLPDGSSVFKAWDKGSQVANICEPEDVFEISDTFKKVFPTVSDCEEFHDECERRDGEDLDEMLIALMKEISQINSSSKLSSPKEHLFSVSGSEVEAVSEFKISDYGDCMDINGTDFNYWS